MIGIVILRVHFGRSLFCNSSFNFFYIDDKEETNLIFFYLGFFHGHSRFTGREGKGESTIHSLQTTQKTNKNITKYNI